MTIDVVRGQWPAISGMATVACRARKLSKVNIVMTVRTGIVINILKAFLEPSPGARMARGARDTNVETGERKARFLMKGHLGEFTRGQSQACRPVALDGRARPFARRPGTPVENAMALTTIVSKSAVVDITVTADACGLRALVDLGTVACAACGLCMPSR